MHEAEVHDVALAREDTPSLRGVGGELLEGELDLADDVVAAVCVVVQDGQHDAPLRQTLKVRRAEAQYGPE